MESLTRSRYATSRYDWRSIRARTGVPLFESELEAWRDARDNVTSEGVDVVLFGNSVLQGVGVSDAAGGWCTKLADLFADEYGPNTTHGPGWCPIRRFGEGSPVWTVTNTSGQSTAQETRGHGLWGYQIVVGDTLTLPAVTFDRIAVRYSTFSSAIGGLVTPGNITVTVDDELVRTEDTYTAGIDNEVFRSHRGTWISDLFDEEPHEVVIGATSAGHGGVGEVVSVDGIFAFRGNHDTGFRFWNGGHQFFSLGTFNNRPLTYDILDQVQPALIVMCHQINDRASSVDFAGRLSAFMAQVAARSPNSSVLLATEFQTAEWTAAGTGAGNYVRYTQMLDQVKAAAVAGGAAWLDVGGSLGNLGFDGTATDPCGFSTGAGLHVNNTGSAAVAEIYRRFLMDEPPAPSCTS